MTTLKHTLRRSDWAYRHLQRGYYGVRGALERRVLGSRLQEWRWRMRGTCFRRAEIEQSWTSRLHPHRDLLMERVAAMSPFREVLEIGCGGGANLARVGERFPGTRLFGVDVNTRAIRFAARSLNEFACDHELSVASASALQGFGDGSVDLVISDAVLMYVGPDRISQAVGEIVRVMRRGAVLIEWHTALDATTAQPSRDHFAHWIHDYRTLFAQHGCTSVRVSPLPQDAWDDTGWRAFGVVIEVDSPRASC